LGPSHPDNPQLSRVCGESKGPEGHSPNGGIGLGNRGIPKSLNLSEPLRSFIQLALFERLRVCLSERPSNKKSRRVWSPS